jgi:hypothetical protein
MHNLEGPHHHQPNRISDFFIAQRPNGGRTMDGVITPGLVSAQQLAGSVSNRIGSVLNNLQQLSGTVPRGTSSHNSTTTTSTTSSDEGAKLRAYAAFRQTQDTRRQSRNSMADGTATVAATSSSSTSFPSFRALPDGIRNVVSNLCKGNMLIDEPKQKHYFSSDFEEASAGSEQKIETTDETTKRLTMGRHHYHTTKIEVTEFPVSYFPNVFDI